MQLKWQKTKPIIYSSEAGDVWREPGEEKYGWYAQLKYSKLTFCFFKSKKEAQNFIHYMGEMDLNYKKRTNSLINKLSKHALKKYDHLYCM